MQTGDKVIFGGRCALARAEGKGRRDDNAGCRHGERGACGRDLCRRGEHVKNSRPCGGVVVARSPAAEKRMSTVAWLKPVVVQVAAVQVMVESAVVRAVVVVMKAAEVRAVRR